MEPHKPCDHQLAALGGSWTSTMRVVGYAYRQVQKHLSLSYSGDNDASQLLQHLRDALALARSHLSFENQTKAWIDTFNIASGPTSNPPKTRSSSSVRPSSSTSSSKGSRPCSRSRRPPKELAEETTLITVMYHSDTNVVHTTSQDPIEFHTLQHFTDISCKQDMQQAVQHYPGAFHEIGDELSLHTNHYCSETSKENKRQKELDSEETMRQPTSRTGLEPDPNRRTVKSPEDTGTRHKGHSNNAAQGPHEMVGNVKPIEKPNVASASLTSSQSSPRITPSNSTSSSTRTPLKVASTLSNPIPAFSKINVDKLSDDNDEENEILNNLSTRQGIHQMVIEHLNRLSPEAYPSPNQMIERLKRLSRSKVRFEEHYDYITDVILEHYWRRVPQDCPF